MPVNIQLFYTANLLDLIGVILAFLFCSNAFCLAIIIYILISKAYSHPIIRLKKYPLLSWMVVGFFQGAFVYLAVYQLINVEETVFFNKTAILPALLASCNLWAFYPITQIYQHKEDALRGDITLSLKLGIRGTFVFTGLLFMVSTIGFYYFFSENNVLLPTQFIIYVGCMLPSLIFFNIWVLKTWEKTEEANFKNTMILNTLGAFCLNLFFIILIITKNNLF